MDAAQEELAQYVFERDRHEFGLGDTLDIKTGLILASLTFLAVQSGGLIEAKLTLSQAIMQTVSITALIFGGALSMVELWPTDYEREALPEKYEQWLDDMRQYVQRYPDADPANLRAARLSSAKARIQKNGRNNRKKSRFMFLAFYCLCASFVANVLTLFMRLF